MYRTIRILIFSFLVVAFLSLKNSTAATLSHSVEFFPKFPHHGQRETTAKNLYDWYLDNEKRQELTGGNPIYNWDLKNKTFSITHKQQGYKTTGKILQLVPGKRIVHTWKPPVWLYRPDEEGLVVVNFVDVPVQAHPSAPEQWQGKTLKGAKIELLQLLPDRYRHQTPTNWYRFHWVNWLGARGFRY